MKKNNTQEYPVHVLRERLRQCAVGQTQALSHSVSRLTSCDALPCLEYQEEVAAEYEVVDHLLYAQQCRAALEQCIANGRVRLSYRWKDGQVTETCFRRVAPGRVKVSGLALKAGNTAQAA